MEYKDILYHNSKGILTVLLSTFASAFLLALRIKWTGHYHMLFLGWNLLLAFIPYALTLLLYKYPVISARSWSKITFFVLWLLFLPNAPYIVTDLIHLRTSPTKLVLFDFLLISIFATTGMVSGLCSIQLMRNFFLPAFVPKYVHYATVTICFLCGYGVYLGRVVRLNSWDVLSRPVNTIWEMAEGLTEPMAWLFIGGFGAVLCGLLKTIPESQGR